MLVSRQPFKKVHFSFDVQAVQTSIKQGNSFTWRIQQKRVSSLDGFLDGLADPLYRFLLRMTRDRDLAADLTQEALLRAWRKRRSLKNEEARRAWLFRIATNLYGDHCRRTRRIELSELGQQVDRTLLPEQAAVDRELHDQVAAALDELPDRQREVMHLRVIEQLSPAEIADILGIDAGAVRSSLAAARKRLRVQLRHLWPELNTTEVPGALPETRQP